MEVLGDRERETKRRRRKRGRKERKGSTSRGECGRAWIDGKGGIGRGPTALVAVERTNFVLIEKSPAPNPIYKPANMAGVGRSLARSFVLLRLTAAPFANPDTQRRRGFSQPCTTYPR